MHPTTAAFASLTWPSKHDAKSEHYAERRKPSIHAVFSPVDPQKLPTRIREDPLFNLAIDSKLRGCDLVGLRVYDVVQGSRVAPRAIVMQKKTQRPVRFEITEQTRDAVAAWIATAHLKPNQFLFPSRLTESPHLSTRQYSRIV